VLGGIFIIAIGDSLSDALGMHISEESVGDGTAAHHKGAWLAMVSTFIFKVLFALIFVVPVLLLSLEIAVWVSVAVGMIIISLFSWVFAKKQGGKPLHAVGEHVLIAGIVVVLTHLVGDFVNYYFGAAV